ncbi:hypothetical protein [Mycobacterium avium]|uniref:hypothetical protein n=1 Tax=Mycobacterium avium TaxID=1764 RepID=UPI000A8C29C8|nr:hypothetical protein [Mycobacterium avium]
MPRYTFGADAKAADPWGIRRQVGPKSIVEADTYRIDSGYVTFLRGDKPFLSVPFSKAPIVAELSEKNEVPITFEE